MRAAELASCLPPSSLALSAVDPMNAWGQLEWLLSDISFHLRVLVWQNTADGHKGVNPPEPLLPHGVKRKHTEPKESIGADAMRMDTTEYMTELRKRKEAAGR